MKFIFYFLSFLATCVFSVHTVYGASSIIRSGDTVTVESSQVLEGDFYGIGDRVTISGEGKHDVFVVGGSVVINAPVHEDFTGVGMSVQTHGSVGDDVRILGGEVIVAEHVSGDVVILAGKASILSTATIDGDVIFLGSSLTIDGNVKGSVYGTGEFIRIDAPILGTVDVRAQSTLTLGDRADIAGNIVYTSRNEVVRSQNASVTGTITRNEMTIQEEVPPLATIVFNILIFTFSGFVMFFLFRRRLDQFLSDIFPYYGKHALLGLGVLFITPLVALMLLVSGIGSIVGLVILLAYGVLVCMSVMSLPILAGVLTQRLIGLGTSLTAFTVILGACVLCVLFFIPFLGILLTIVGFLIVLGYAGSRVYHYLRQS